MSTQQKWLYQNLQRTRPNRTSHYLRQSLYYIGSKRIHASNRDENLAMFDGEDRWDEERNGFVQGKSGSFMNQALTSVDIIADKITQMAMDYVPESASYDVVKVSVVGGLLLVVLSFVKGIISFVLTIGTIVFGAYVSVKVFGIESSDNGRRKKGGRKRAPSKRQGMPRDSAVSTGGKFFLDNLSSLISKEDDDGLIDVTFADKKKKKK